MLTDSKIKAATTQARDSGKAVTLYDTGGLYIILNPPPSNGWWRIKFRFNGKSDGMSMGVYPTVSLKMARKRRDAARALLEEGINPRQHRKSTKREKEAAATNTFEAIARDWYVKRQTKWAKSHSSRLIRLLERDVFPWLGRRPVSEVTAPELLAVIRRIEHRGAIDTSHRALQVCGQVFRYAVATGRLESDPSRDLRGALEHHQGGHFAAVTDNPERLAEILNAMDEYKGGLVVRCALRLMPLVFTRPGELRHAKWRDIDLDAGEWRFRVSKTGNDHLVPLSKQAVVILEELQPLTDRDDGGFVFPSARGARAARPMSDNAVLTAMRAMGIGKDEMTGHGFRAVARTMLHELLGFKAEVIEHQLAHRVADTLGTAYNRTKFIDERKRMMQVWADYLDALKAGTAKEFITTMRTAEGNIIPFQKAEKAAVAGSATEHPV